MGSQPIRMKYRTGAGKVWGKSGEGLEKSRKEVGKVWGRSEEGLEKVQGRSW